MSNIEYKSFIINLLGKPERRNQAEWTYKCPFEGRHEGGVDIDPSFHFNVDEGVYHCKACSAQGNALELYSKLKNLEISEAKRELNERYRLDYETEGAQKLTLERYASSKNLREELLKKLDVRNGEGGIKIPYKNTEGEEVSVRTRTKMYGENKFIWRSGDETTLYGLWRKNNYNAEKLILCEGSSDAHTLWQHSYSALGLPGIGHFKEEWAEKIEELNPGKIVIIQEDGARREVLEIAKTLDELSEREVNILSLPIDDVSDFYLKSPDTFKKRFEKQLSEGNLEEANFSRDKLRAEYRCLTQSGPKYKGETFRVHYPYLLDDKLRKYKHQGSNLIDIASRPIYIGEKIKDQVEKDKEYVTLVWENGGIKYQTIPRQKAFNHYQSGIQELANYGAPVNSTNARNIVEFFDNFESWNHNKLSPIPGSSQFGWVDLETLTFLIGEESIGGECRFIAKGDEEKRLARGYQESGERAEWVKLWNQLETPQARFAVSSLFASPLIALLKERPALLYIYGESGIGKTAAMKLGLSAFGKPEAIMDTPFSTLVGLEEKAALLNDLPLAADERQSSGEGGFLEQFVYMLSGGQSKSRGKKDGGLRVSKRWRLFAVMTGEEDLTTSQLKGIENRSLQLHLTDLLEESLAIEIHKKTKTHHGHVGREYIRHLINKGRKEIREDAREIYEVLYEDVNMPGGKLTILKLITLAEKLLLETLSKDDARDVALNDARTVTSNLSQQEGKTMAERGREFIFNKVDEYDSDEGSNSIRRKEDELWIKSDMFKDWIRNGDFTKNRLLNDFEAKGWIKKRGSSGYTIKDRVDGSQIYFYIFDLDEMEDEDEVDIPF
ncbi:DUF927 domain-containing protein [Candidatus Bipolaricaulota bacterium]|nr:DUF927 domain-containing protein [Candidatus Bipolaricaulota bacterium]